jgi:uncharacterized protein (UPF0335 family)
LTLSNEDIVEYLERLESESKAIKNELLRICWYMRGSISYEESWFLTFDEKDIINKLIKENMETIEKTGIPFV